MLKDLNYLISAGLFDELISNGAQSRSQTLSDIVERAHVDCLYLISNSGRVLLSPSDQMVGRNLVEEGILTSQDLAALTDREGTVSGDEVTPVSVTMDGSEYYFYAMRLSRGSGSLTLLLGEPGSTLTAQIGNLTDVDTAAR